MVDEDGLCDLIRTSPTVPITENKKGGKKSPAKKNQSVVDKVDGAPTTPKASPAKKTAIDYSPSILTSYLQSIFI